MQLRRLAALERERLQNEHEELLKRIAEVGSPLGDPVKILSEIKTETRELKRAFKQPPPHL